MAYSDKHDQLQCVMGPPAFKPAKPWNWVVSIGQTFIRIDLFLHNQLNIQEQDLQLVRNLPRSLEARVRWMETRLSRYVRTHALKERTGLILAEVLHRKEIALQLKAGSARLSELSTRILDVQRSVLQQLETPRDDLNPSFRRMFAGRESDSI